MLISIYADNVSFGNMNEYLMQTNIIEFEEIGEFSEKIALSNEIDPDTTKEEDLSALREDVEIEDITGLDNEISQHLVIVDEFEDNVDIVNSEIDIDNSLDLESLVIAVDNRTFIKPYEEDKDKLQPAEDEETEQYVDTNDQDDNIIEDYDNEKDNEIITLSTEELTNILDDVIGSYSKERYKNMLPEERIPAKHGFKQVKLRIARNILKWLVYQSPPDVGIFTVGSKQYYEFMPYEPIPS